MLKRWFEIIFDHRIGLRERMFRVVTGISMIALVIILLMGRNLVNLLILAVSLCTKAPDAEMVREFEDVAAGRVNG